MRYTSLKKLSWALIISILGIIGLSHSANALDRTAWGSRDASFYATSSNEKYGYSRSSGATWYYYDIKENAAQTVVDIPFNPRAYAKVAVSVEACKPYGGFWVLLRNEYKMISDDETMTKTESTNLPAGAVFLSEVDGPNVRPTNYIRYVDQTGAPSQEEKNDADTIKAVHYGTMAEVSTAYGVYKDTSAIPSGSSWEDGNLSYFCASYGDNAIPDEEIDFSTYSTVTLGDSYTSAPVIDGTSYVGQRQVNDSDTSFTVPKDSTIEKITFKHYVANTTSDTIGERKYDVRINVNGLDYYSRLATEDVIENVAVGDQPITICRDYTVNQGYSPIDYSLKSAKEEHRSAACITITPVETLGVTINSCKDGGGMDLSVQTGKFGNTLATVGLAVNGNLQTTTAAPTDSSVNPNHALYGGSTITAYAKPGDTVQFSYALCFGALDSADNSGSNFRKASFKVYSGTGYNEQDVSELLFGRAYGALGWEVIARNSRVRTGQLTADDSFFYNSEVTDVMQDREYVNFNNNDHQIAFASPDNVPEPNPEGNEDATALLSCAIYSNPILSSGDPWHSGGFVVPGLQYVPEFADNCLSATLGDEQSSRSNVVGSTLSQTLEYTFSAYWPKTIGGESFLPEGYGSSGADREAEVDSLLAAREKYLAAYEYYKTNKSAGSVVWSTETAQKTAQVKIPYNFDTHLASRLVTSDDNLVHPGEQVTFSATVDILPRINELTSDFSNDENGNKAYIPYATLTPPDTQVKIVEVLIRDTGNPTENVMDVLNYNTEKTNGGAQYSGRRICQYYNTKLGDLVTDGSCTETVVKGYKAVDGTDPDAGDVGNNESNPSGEMGYYNKEVKLTTPDVEAGTKYCVAIAINHGDSHGLPGKERLTAEEGANAQSVNGSYATYISTQNWSVSPMSCRTVVKEPNFQVWNNNVYSSGDISTSVSHKAVNARAGKFNDETANVEPSYFGSWGEYLVVAKGDVDGFSSANALGYSTNYFWIDKSKVTDGSTTTIIETEHSLSGGGYSWYDANGNKHSVPETDPLSRSLISNGYGSNALSPQGRRILPTYCEITRLTIANAECLNATNTSAGNYASSTADDATLATFKQRILKIDTSQDDVTYPYILADSISELGDSYTSLSINNADYLKVDPKSSNVFSINKPISRQIGEKTLIIQVDGHLDIDANICLGEGSCKDVAMTSLTGINSFEAAEGYLGIIDPGNPTGQAAQAEAAYEKLKDINNLSLTARNTTEYHGGALKEYPQIIIIAESISIGSEVSQIDAWLITNSAHASSNDIYSNGYVNTCKEFKAGQTATNTCWKTLKINGPVITSALLLNRTGGAWPGYSGDVGSPVYDVLRIIYQKYYNSWRDAAESICGGNEQYEICYTREFNSRQEEFKNALGPDTDPKVKEIMAIYEAISYYAANSRTLSAGRASSGGNGFLDSRDLTCDGSITPAEIFDLHPFTYLWAYGEALKSNQAIITYAQEFAPRY